MTVAELLELCISKIREENPLRLSKPSIVITEPTVENFCIGMEEITAHMEANFDYQHTLADAITQAYRTLYEEMGITHDALKSFSPATPLPPRANALAEKLRNFPIELTERIS
jgi:hypothetical protein